MGKPTIRIQTMQPIAPLSDSLSRCIRLIDRQQARLENARSAARVALHHFAAMERVTDGHYTALSEFRMETMKRLESVRDVQLPELPPCQGGQKPVQSVSKALPGCPEPAL